jgi:DnaJ like chaperone protein
MNWWGKLIGGAFGFMLGGPLGALLGGVLGHNFDRGLKRVLGAGPGAHGQERRQLAFFTATFAVMGRVAKADGRVSADEIGMARQVMAQMRLSEEQKQAAIKLFNEGKQPDFPLDDVLDQFRSECRGALMLLQMFLEIQILTALADGTLAPAEHKLLLYICERLGVPQRVFEQLVAMVQAQQHYAHGGGAGPAQPRGPALKDAYAVLGVSDSVDDDAVKKAYRKLMSQNHPDKLVAKGLPEEMMEMAKRKTQEIQAAYEQVKQSRGMR